MDLITEKSIESVIVVYNKFFPLPGFAAIMLFGRIYARKSYGVLSESVVRHELIHAAQAADCGSWIGYYLLYLKYWLRFGYSDNPLEREAYRYMYVSGYLDSRQGRSWESYLG